MRSEFKSERYFITLVSDGIALSLICLNGIPKNHLHIFAHVCLTPIDTTDPLVIPFVDILSNGGNRSELYLGQKSRS